MLNKEEWREVDRTGLSTAWRIGLAVLAACLFAVVLSMILGGLSWVTAPFRGALDQREKTVADGDYRIAAYDEFFNSCEAIAAKERIIERYEEQLSTAEGDQKARLQAAVTGESNARDELIADYNADAAKAGTRGQFRSSDLPFTIDPNGRTTCTA